MTKRKFEAVAPDGTVITRMTAREYTHAVLVGPSVGRPGWGAWSFNGRIDLAVKERDRATRAWRGEAEVVMVPCHEARS